MVTNYFPWWLWYSSGPSQYTLLWLFPPKIPCFLSFKAHSMEPISPGEPSYKVSLAAFCTESEFLPLFGFACTSDSQLTLLPPTCTILVIFVPFQFLEHPSTFPPISINSYAIPFAWSSHPGSLHDWWHSLLYTLIGGPDRLPLCSASADFFIFSLVFSHQL